MTTQTLDTAATPASYAELLTAALGHVEADVPEAHTRFVNALSDTVLTLQLAGERFGLVGGSVVPDPPQSGPSLALEPRALLALIEGRLSLTDALARDQVRLLGIVPAVVAIDRALQLLLHGIVRSPAAPMLLQQLRSITERDANSSPEEHP